MRSKKEKGFYDRLCTQKGFTLGDKIYFYRLFKKNIFIGMSMIILFLVFLNYSNMIACNRRKPNGRSFENVNDYETELRAELKIESTKILEPPAAVDVSNISLKTNDTNTYFNRFFEIPDFLQINMPHLKEKGRHMRPRYLRSRNNKRKRSITIGVPTVKRKSVSYLKAMLNSLFESFRDESKETKKSILVVVMIAEVILNKWLIFGDFFCTNCFDCR